ncbi:MAG TPA: TetR/AcrR family transcriptional regulator [Thermoleophilaceae bacterium]|nr:TetR/AcrR family transcriptional regulator [Thermoleophilaceae bacterium]
MNPPPEPLEVLAEAEPAAADEEADGRRRRGNRTRESILQTAADLASVEGLRGLTIGRLAAELGMSKSGLFAHFGSKEELQLATVDAARRRFVEHVVKPSRHLPRGRARVEALVDDWFGYYRAEVFRGGCFFHTVKAEFDSQSEGAVRQVVIDDAREFLAFLTREVRKAQEAGDLSTAVEPEQIAFELDALGAAANQQFQLMRDPAVFDRAKRAIEARLDAVAT